MSEAILSKVRKLLAKAEDPACTVAEAAAFTAKAAELIARFGAHAASEAAARADRSREVGNVEHFCRWRQIERLIATLAAGRSGRSLH